MSGVFTCMCVVAWELDYNSPPFQVSAPVRPRSIAHLLLSACRSESGYKANLLAKGMAASPGAAVGRVVFTAEDAAAWKERGETVILVRSETSAEDVGGMHCAQGILTAHGGMTSHAAVVARGWGKPCVTGCGDLKIDAAGKVFVCTPLSKSLTPEVGFTVVEGDWISIHGGTGEVIWGKQELVATEVTPELTAFSAMSARFCPIHVHANADNREDALVALQFGARGIGLVRTEHMFWGPERIHHMRDVILGSTTEQRQSGLDALLVVQQGDFRDIFMAVAAAAKAEGRPCYPVTIRLLDPPLHEYLPYQTAQQEVRGGVHAFSCLEKAQGTLTHLWLLPCVTYCSLIPFAAGTGQGLWHDARCIVVNDRHTQGGQSNDGMQGCACLHHQTRDCSHASPRHHHRRLRGAARGA